MPLRVSSFVVDIEIESKPVPICYEQGVTCDIIDSAKAARLQSIPESDEYDNWQDEFDNRFEQVQRL